MSRLKDVFSRQPEKMSSMVKWVFGLPIGYVIYLVISMILPNQTYSDNAFIVSQLLRSLLLVLCTVVAVKTVVGFDCKKFFSESGKWNWLLFLKGFFIMVIALIVTNLCLFFIFPSSFSKRSLQGGTALNWFFSLLLVIVSALSEEMIFRSYIAWFGKKPEDKLCCNQKKYFIYALVSAVVFSIAHFSNPEVESSAIWSMFYYCLFGFCLMLCLLKTKGIEFSLGIHVANNLFAAWILNYNNSVLPTQSIFINEMPISFITVLQAVMCLVFCILFCPENCKIEKQ